MSSAPALKVISKSPKLELERFANGELEAIAMYNALTLQGGFAELSRQVEIDDLTTHQAQTLYGVADELRKSGISPDLDTVACRLVDLGRLNEIGGISGLASLGEGMPRLHRAESLVPYCRSLRRIAIRRRAYREAEQLRIGIESGIDVAPEDFAAASKRLRELESVLDSAADGMGIADAIESCGGIDALLTPPARVVPVPWSGLRKLMPGGGFRPGQLWTLAARPGVGKSAAALQIGADAAIYGRRVGLFSLEMSRTELLQRLMAMRTRISLGSIQSGFVAGQDRCRIMSAMDEMDSRHLEIFDDVHTLSGISARIADRRKKRVGYDLAVIDYLQLVSPSRRTDTRNNEVSQVTRGLKLAAMENECTVLALSQLKRLDDDREPQLSDLRDSGSIEQDSDGVIFLHPSRKDPAGVNLLVKKQRNGPQGFQRLRFYGSVVTFEEEAEQGRDYGDNDE